MSDFLFFALAKHHRSYFGDLLRHTGVDGIVVGLADLPWPRPTRWKALRNRIPWARLVEEKCQERRAKGKSAGSLYRSLLRVELAWTALRLDALLGRSSPRAVVMWNGSNRHCQLLLSILPCGTATWFVENGLLPNTTTLDPRGVNYLNSLPRHPEFYRSISVPPGWAPASRALVPRKSKAPVGDPIGLPPRYIFVPFQDERDSQIRLFSPWIKDMRSLFRLMHRVADDSGMSVVFKEHPSSRERFEDLHRLASERLVFANGNTTQELIERSEFVVTINSTIGLESLLLDKPVIVLGDAFYKIPELVMHASEADELLATVGRFPYWDLDARLRRAFLYYLAERYCIPGDWRQPSTAHWAKVTERLLNGKKPGEGLERIA